MNSRLRARVVLCLLAISLVCLIFGTVTLGAEMPTTDRLFSGTGVAFTTEATDGKTDRQGLMLSADAGGASAKFKLDLSGKLQIDLKSPDSSVSEFSLRLTDNLGHAFTIGTVSKAMYDDVFVELEGKRGGIYYFSDKWDFVTGYTAGYNNLRQEYTQFWRTYSKENRNDTENPVTANADCLHLQFDPQTMQVGLKRFAADDYLLVWDLSETTNDGHDIGANISCFGDYSLEIVFDKISGERGNLLLYTLNGYDLSQKYLQADDILSSISVPVTAKAVKGESYVFPAAVAKDLNGVVSQAVTTKVSGRTLTEYTPRSDSPFTVTYEYGSFAREVEIPVVSSVTSDLEDDRFPDTVGVNQRLELASGSISTNLSYYDVPLRADVQITDGDGASVSAEGDSFVAEKAGVYTVRYTALDGAFTKEYKIEATEEQVGIDYQVFANVYRVNDVLTVNSASVEQNGQSLAVSTTVRYPSGKAAEAGEIVLDQTGYYTIIHRYDSDGEKKFEQTILVEEASADLFEGPSTVELSYGIVEGNNDFSGVKLTFQGDKEVEYQKVIDLSDNRFDEETNTGDLLLELVAQPSAIGTPDMERIEIVFTDVEDPTNTLSIRLAYFEGSQTVTKVHAKGPGQAYTSRRPSGEYTTVADSGFNARHSFIQTVRYNGVGSLNGTFENYTLRLYYDYEENALYANPEWDYSDWLVLDLNDPTAFPTNPWNGFSIGKVRMSLKVSGVSNVADLYLLNIDGVQLDDEMFTDRKPPIITAHIEGSAPLAAAGRPYRLIGFDAADLDSGVSETWWEVYDESGAQQAITGDAFTPSAIGKYTMRLFAKDYFGNVATKDIIINAIEYVAGVSLTVNGEVPKTAIYGQSVSLPGCSSFGGAGQTQITVSVRKDGREIPVEDGAFFAGEEGLYIVTYKAEDYIGNVNTKSYFVTVTMGTRPSLDESAIQLPVAFIHGEEYTFEDYRASFYAGAGAAEEQIAAEITVQDAQGSRTLDGLSYTPVVTYEGQTVEQISVTFTFRKEGSEALEITKTTRAVHPMKGEGYLTDYFLTENASADANSNGIVFSALAPGDMQIGYIRPLSTHELSVMFATQGTVTKTLSDEQILQLQTELVGSGKPYASNEELDTALAGEGVDHNGFHYYKTRLFYYRESYVSLQSFSSIEVRMQDAKDPANCVTVTYKNEGTQFLSNVCGAEQVASINANNEFSFCYDGETNMVTDINSNKLGAITRTDAGKSFQGFSGDVYVTITVRGITGECSMLFKQIDNHAFNDSSADYIDPVLWLNGDLGGRYSIGSVVTIPTASGYDVLSSVQTPTVSVTAPDGKELLTNAPADIEYRLTIGQYGYYYVNYVLMDSSGRQISITKSLLVLDDRAPSLEFGGQIPSTAKAGEEITLPAYTIQDNDVSGVTVYVTVRKPDGQFERVEGNTFRPDQTGLYTINYFVIDADGNTELYSYNVVVS